MPVLDFDSVSKAVADQALKRRLVANAGWPPGTVVGDSIVLHGDAPVLPATNPPGNFGLSADLGTDLARIAAEAASSILGPDAMDVPFGMSNSAFHTGTLEDLSPWFGMAINDYTLSLTWRCLRDELREMGQMTGKLDPTPEWEGNVGFNAFVSRIQKRLARELPEVLLPGGAKVRITFSSDAKTAVRKAEVNNALLAAVLKNVIAPYLTAKNV